MMKEKLILMAILAATVYPVWAGVDSTVPLPEPSTIGLFAAAAVAITVLAKLKK
ncbi:MAG: PEP-CTERM sorting domain-containing protein [Pseudomonadales bacterium]|nr:PEP-CTERM sorting domain-containing protein [Pseudomonadales bacterium]